MPTIYDIPPLEVQQNLQWLREDLDLKIPAKALDRNLLIASWNIRAFGDLTRKWESQEGDSPKRDLHAILCIAEIIKRFDLIALQEVKANLRALRDTLKVLGDHWSLILTDVAKGDSGNGERMAYLFDSRRVKMSGLACELVVPNEWTEKETTLIITGDHGFVDVHTQMSPNVLLAERGLHKQKNGNTKAFFTSAGGSAFLHLGKENDIETLEQVRQLLQELPLEESRAFELLEREEIAARGGDPRAVLALTANRGYSFGNAAEGELLAESKGGKHGYYPNFHDIATGFVGFGKGVRQGLVIENMYLEDVGKIIAELLEIELNQGPEFFHSTLDTKE